MQVTVPKIIPQEAKHKVTVKFYDEEAHYHQSCEVEVFVDNDASLTLLDIQNSATQKARDFLAQCLV